MYRKGNFIPLNILQAMFGLDNGILGEAVAVDIGTAGSIAKVRISFCSSSGSN